MWLTKPKTFPRASTITYTVWNSIKEGNSCKRKGHTTEKQE